MAEQLNARLPQLDYAGMNEAQRTAHDAMVSGPRGYVIGPLSLWLHSPGVCMPAQELGAHCRFGTVLGTKLAELTICCVAVHFRSGYEWNSHAVLSLNAGLDPAILGAIGDGVEPAFVDDDERIVWRFATELLRTHVLSDATYAPVEARFGAAGVVDLIGIIGYYSLVSLTINGLRIAPKGPTPFEVAR